MKFLTMIINLMNKILAYISNDPTVVDVFLSFVGVVFVFLGLLGGAICFIDAKIVAYSDKQKNHSKRLLKEYNSHISSALKNESVFFCEDDPKKMLYYRNVPIKKYNSGRNSCLAKLKLSSYLLLGEAGCGKSSIIKKDYLCHCSKFMRFWRIHTGFVYINQQFINNGVSGMSSLDEIINCVHNTKYRNIYLYIDGIDEFGESKFDEIFKSFKPLSKQIKKVKITCRTNFALQNIINHNNERIFGFKERQRYIVSSWQQKHLKKMANFLLRRLNVNKTIRKGAAARINTGDKDWCNYITNPLLMKLYLYILLHGDQEKKIDVKNKYLFYTQFVTEVISTQRKRQNNYRVSQIGTELDSLSVDVFNAFSENHKFISYNGNVEALLKPSINGVSHFVHETFFEYFVARNYLLQLSKEHPDETSVAVLHQTYTNDFADFITSALNGTVEEMRKQIVNSLFSIYYATFAPDVSKRLNTRFFAGTSAIVCSSYILRAVKQLSDRKFFTLKYEIIFRLGRIDVVSDKIIDFLNFVYKYDENVNIKENAKYYVAVLKRCCAISSSFLGSEQIELDYVRKMLPSNKYGTNTRYIPNYDLANRSHTLLFYGDIIRANIFDFKDDSTNNPYSLAFSKRIERLQLDLPENIALMNKKQKKKYYFRVFDLATIYTFMYHRKRLLTNEEFKIISKTRVHFTGASEDRNSIMNEILELILKLNDKLNGS